MLLGLKIAGTVAAVWLFPASGDWPAPRSGLVRLASLVVVWAAIWA
jgi:hypothetical protein